MNSLIPFLNDLIYCGCYGEPISCTAQIPKIFHFLSGFLECFKAFS